MKYYTFYRETNQFDDILNDNNVKSNVRTKMRWNNYLLIGFKHKIEDSVLGYIVLKYGDDIVSLVNRDYTPKAGVDYMPDRSDKF